MVERVPGTVPLTYSPIPLYIPPIYIKYKEMERLEEVSGTCGTLPVEVFVFSGKKLGCLFENRRHPSGTRAAPIFVSRVPLDAVGAARVPVTSSTAC